MTVVWSSVAPDLVASPPRRWNTTVDGIIWLPRMIDKARAYDAGTLGEYLFGQSPLDDAFLHAAGIGYDGLLDAVRDAHDDGAVLAGIERRAPGAIARLESFTQRPPLHFRLILPALDLDEGYVKGRWAPGARSLLAVGMTPIAAFLRRSRPVPPPPMPRV